MSNQEEFKSDDPHLMDYVFLIYIRRRFILSFIFIAVVIGLVLSASLPKKYAAEVTFVSLSKSMVKGVADRGSELSALSAALAAVGNQSGNAFYVALVESRRIQDSIIDELNLIDYYETDREGARGLLKERTVVEELKGGFVKLRVSDARKEMAQKIAARYGTGVNKYLQSVSLTEGQKYEAYLKEQIAETNRSLNQNMQEREFRVKEGVYFTLLKEYELARANAAKERMDVQIVDEAEAFSSPIFPSRRIFLIISFGLGVILSFLIVFIQQWWKMEMSSPRNISMMKKMREKRISIVQS